MTSTPPRIAYLDNLRILVTCLVVLHHIAITYGAPGSWYFYDTPVGGIGVILLTVFTALNSSFFMGIFFLLAGYFTPRSYDRKGPFRFLWNRMLRLGLPLAAYSFLLSPLIRALLTVRVWTPGAAFWPTYWAQIRDVGFSPGPLWFVTALLIFSGVYAVVRFAASTLRREHGERSIPLTNRQIIAFGLLIGLAIFLVRIVYPSGREWFVFQLGDFPQYIALFIAGVFAYRRDWFSKLTRKQGRQWSRAILGLAIALGVIGGLGGAFDGDPSEFAGGFTWQSFVASLWWSMQGLAIIVALLVGFRERLNRQGQLAKELARDAYGVYIFHAPVVVAFSLLFLSTDLSPALKLPLVAISGLAICFIIAAALRRLPLAKGVL